MSEGKPATPVAAATVLIVRDGADGLEVFMVKRHHQIDFVAGALVFPGGKVHGGDREAALSDHMDGAEAWTPEMRALGAAAIREAFEESGILFARDANGTFVSTARLAELDAWRERLEKNSATLLEMVQREQLRLACDRLVRF